MAVPSLKISSLVARSAGYVKANVAKANTNGNAFLTKAEAKALPKDLQDNYEAHRQGSQDNGVVTAQKFVEKYTDYVAINLSKATRTTTATSARAS